MADTPKENKVKYTRFHTAFSTLAPDKTFGGIKLSDFTAQVGKSNARRENLQRIKDEVIQEEAALDGEDNITMKMCERIKNGVIADEDFGDDSALYEALGFIRRSEKKSGLTRKKKKEEPPEE